MDSARPLFGTPEFVSSSPPASGSGSPTPSPAQPGQAHNGSGQGAPHLRQSDSGAPSLLAATDLGTAPPAPGGLDASPPLFQASASSATPAQESCSGTDAPGASLPDKLNDDDSSDASVSEDDCAQEPASGSHAAWFKTLLEDDTDIAATMRWDGVDLDARNEQGRTLLHVAAHKGKSNVALSLIKAGAKVNAVDADGATPLCHAIIDGNFLMVERLLNNGATLERRDKNGNTPLILACKEGNAGVVGALLNSGKRLSIDGTDKKGHSALSAAVMYGSSEIVRLLAQAGANLQCTSWNENFLTPLMVAAFHGDKESVAILLEYGALVDDVDRFGNTALMHAACFGRTVAASHLLWVGADINHQNMQHETPLLWAIAQGREEMTRLLLLHNAKTSFPDCFGSFTWIESSSRSKDSGMQGEETRAKIEPGRRMRLPTPRAALHAAAAQGNAAIVKMLLAANVDINLVGPNGETALSQAHAHGHDAIVQMLLAKGADDAPRNQGRGPGEAQGQPTRPGQ